MTESGPSWRNGPQQQICNNAFLQFLVDPAQNSC